MALGGYFNLALGGYFNLLLLREHTYLERIWECMDISFLGNAWKTWTVFGGSSDQTETV